MGKLGGRSGKIGGTFVGEGPGKGQTRVEEQQSRMDLNKGGGGGYGSAGQYSAGGFGEAYGSLPSPTCMVVRVVVPVNGWGPVQEVVQFLWKHTEMEI